MSASRLAHRLSMARKRGFVGREGELALFREALSSDDASFAVLHLYGPGGIGKTTLLGEFLRLCEETRTPAYVVDGRDIEVTVESFLDALRQAMGLPDGAEPLARLAAHEGRQVLVIDTYEALASLDHWLRERALPELHEQTIVALASAHPPSSGWRLDPGWQALVRALPLRNLSPDESRRYLAHRGVPEEQWKAVLAFTHGHPLALSLIADVFAQRRDTEFTPEATPDIVRSLLERLMKKAPGPAHRAALEVCALVRLTTEPLLAAMLTLPDAHDLFNWLRDLSFIESGPEGLFPHDLAREALMADLRWRNPDWYGELHTRARNHYSARLQQAPEREQHRILLDYIYLHRDSPVLRPHLVAASWEERARYQPDGAARRTGTRYWRSSSGTKARRRRNSRASGSNTSQRARQSFAMAHKRWWVTSILLRWSRRAKTICSATQP